MKRNAKSLAIYIVVFLVLMFIVLSLLNSVTNMPDKSYSFNEFYSQMKAKEILSVEVIKTSQGTDVGKAKIILKDKTSYQLNIPVLSIFVEDLQNQSEEYEFTLKGGAVETPSLLGEMLPMIIVLFISVIVIVFIFQQMQGGSGNRAMSFGKSRAKMVVDSKKKITFANVAGLDEEKVELQEIVDFFKQSKKFIEMGARIPKGVLLEGPPGTGKTLLAKAVAGEAGVPFFSISGSDFVEMFVGVGASRVRDLFEQAKKNTPCIIFIDEIDAVGRKRGSGLGGGHDEREQTLNQLLVEMDGFGINEGIIVISATNRPDILDPALLRPGRFDRRVVVGKPDSKGREEILKIHAKGKLIGDDVDFKAVALSTSGFTGADLENLMNESALLAVRHGKKAIDMEEIRKAFIKVDMGTEKKSRVVTVKEKRSTAYHEAGHAILLEILPDLDHVHIVSIIPTGRAGGYTMSIPTEDRWYWSKEFLMQNIMVSFGGRIAEELVLGEISSGASGDIKSATSYARAMVTQFGMSELGPILYDESGSDFSHYRNYSEDMASKIDEAIKKIVDEAYIEAKKIIVKHIDILHTSVDLLLEKERITGEEFRALFPDGIIQKEETIAKFGQLIDVED